MTPFSFRRQAGFSLIELLLVLGVIAILLIAAFVVYPQVRERIQIDREVKAIQFVNAKLKSIYAADPRKCGDLTAAQAGNMDLFPGSTFDPITNTYSNGLGGTYSVQGAAGTSNATISFGGSSLQGAICDPLLRAIHDVGLEMATSGRPVVIGTDLSVTAGGRNTCPPQRALSITLSCR